MHVQHHNSNMNTGYSAIEYTETEYLPYSDKQLFNLITDVEKYPDFLPGWLSVKVKSRNEIKISARQKIGIPLFYWEFDSEAKLDEPRHIQILAQDGPFQHLNIHWYLDPVTRQMTKVTIKVQADIVRHAKIVLNELVEKSVHSLLEHFAARASDVYGER